MSNEACEFVIYQTIEIKPGLITKKERLGIRIIRLRLDEEKKTLKMIVFNDSVYTDSDEKHVVPS